MSARFVVHGRWGREAAEAFALENEDPEYPDLIPRDRKRKIKRKDAGGDQRQNPSPDRPAPG